MHHSTDTLGLKSMGTSTSANKKHKCRGKYAERGTQAFWDARLKRMGLGLDAGQRADLVTYGHMIRDLDWDGKILYTPPIGERLDDSEWPVSLL